MENMQDFDIEEVSNRRLIVEFFYRLEPIEWHRKVHKRGGTIQENIKDTLESISDSSKMYVVNVKGELAAFFVRYEDCNGNLALEGYHIAKQFRNSDFIPKFWEQVKEKFERDFVVGICDKNEAAIQHLMRQGFEVVNKIVEDGKIFFILKYKIKTLCL